MNDKSDWQPTAAAPYEGKSKKATAVQFLLRGLAISLPPVLTLVILLWVAGGVNDYIIIPISTAVKFAIAAVVEDVRPTRDFLVLEQAPPLEHCDSRYRVTPRLKSDLPALVSQYKNARRQIVDEQGAGPGNGAPQPPLEMGGDMRLPVLQDNLDQVWVPLGDQAVPYTVYAEVADNLGPRAMPPSAMGVYMELVTTRYFRSLFNLSAVAVALTVVLLYFIGRFVTARLGNWIVGILETRVMARLPLVSNVYSSVKQVTDFVFKERTVSYNRVVAIEYPRKGVWAVAFVTNDSGMLEMTAAAGEPLLTVLVPTSPMPMTGFTICVRRREAIDLNITVDQAFQFCLSCGVLIPQQQRVTPELLQRELARRLTGEAPALPANATDVDPGAAASMLRAPIAKDADGRTSVDTTGPNAKPSHPSQ